VRASLADLARSLEAAAAEAGERPPGIGDLVDDLRERARSGEEPRAAGVTVATLHATKGQEWAHVFVLGAHDGGIPATAAGGRAAGPDALEEERRLLYVGLTRARDGLTVSWSARHRPDRQTQRRPSRFLQPLLEQDDAGVDIRLHRDGPAR
jgi:DNA helicase-2/ATP-dependent DNA helicase PcrA